MKPRSTVAALLAVTEMLLAARAKAARASETSARQTPDATKAPKIVDNRPLLVRIKTQAIS
jgi:hypothetical protein